jgi:hypothetical protein
MKTRSSRRLSAPVIATFGLLTACGGATTGPNPPGPPPEPEVTGHQNPPGVEPPHKNPPAPEPTPAEAPKE